MTGQIRVLLVDDQTLLRQSFRVLVDSEPDLTTVGEAGTGADAVDLARQTHPDVVLMDIRMPDTDGIEATRHICAAPDTIDIRVLILTTFDLDAYVYAALRAGASGFLLKDAPPADVLAGVRTVASGDALLAPTVTRRLIAEFARQARPARAPSSRLGVLTERERDVLHAIACGLSNAELAEHFHLSVATVKTHVGSLLAKLHARDRAQLVITAYESRLVAPEPPRP